MQIDFHHAATYVLARFAEFSHTEADIIAYCAQYVDDATNSGTILFDNGAAYTRVSSAHKTFDYRNFSDLATRRVWLPFHFLPGNNGKTAGENPEGSFIEKIICRPNSPIAQDMMDACIEEQNTPYGLHRLGLTMHVYADTWAHRGFAGVNHEVNDIRCLDDHDEPDPTLLGRVSDFFGDTFDQVTSTFIGGALPLGHGAVLSYPDRPFLKWSYLDCNHNKVHRDNPKDYMEAAQAMYQAMRRYRLRDPKATVAPLPDKDCAQFEWLIYNLLEENHEARHQLWVQHIADSYFSFGPATIEYIAKGPGSWKHQALGTTAATDAHNEVFPYHPSFLKSNWKRFHDALQAHRLKVLNEILPRYGICTG